ncbi:protein Atossa [Zeugodacus cucurbitae]|uniref:Protein FAM214A n=2 Tax=Zeugodacus cucurbitae TaxID=28588 RepID=A0A0A1XD69_ZEUCU|nr:protein Atossa [Zeugodacus cucurbitae]XP_054090469.1 protein Atossa [Zeugodacus cucurbitae]XP_054090470.1 protein Atossa [Zeugodacus cucurbitae]XP_054090471.1 protein Atossa [Zeugodacus cucurbitae]XP_054090472.1 protein Atossa [Zeugodacus cucurbitae]
MIPTTVSSSTSTATVSGATGNNHSTSNNGQVNMLLSTTPTANTVSSTATTPPAAQSPSVLLGLASLILEGRALADDEYQPQIMRSTAPVSDTSGLSGSGHGGHSIGSGTVSSVGNHLHNYNTSGLLAKTSYGISGSGVGGAAVGGGRQSPTSRPSTSRAAAGFGVGVVGSGHVINITTNPYAFNNSGVSAAHVRDASPLYIDPYSANSSGSASSSAESTHQRWTQKLCQLRQVSPAANLSTTYEQPVAVEAREPELVALAINESGANERGDFEIVRRSLLNRTNLNAMCSATSVTATGGSSAGAGSASSSPGSGSDNFLLSLQSLATTCLRSGSPSIEPNHSGMSANSATGTPNSYRFATLSSPPPPQSMYIYRATTPTASASATAHRFLEQPGSGSSCGSGVQSPRPHWPTVVDNLHTKERYMRHASATSGMNFGSGRIPIPGTAVNTTTASVAVAAAATINHTTKVTPTTAATTTTTASKHPQQGPHCDQFLRKMGLAKGEAAEAEDHFCDMSYVNITCSRWRAYCHKMEAIIGRGEPVCIEVYLGPVNHKMLLEQWIITQKEKVPPPTMTLPSLCSAIRSQLYFSQISAWCDLIKKSDKTIYDTGRIIFHTPTGAAGDLATPVGSANNAGSNITPGTSPNSHTLNNQLNNALSVNRRPRLNIFYRIKSFDSTACFNSKPNVHNFPNVNVSENCSISVCLKSLPRINGGIPKIGTLMLSTPGTTMATPTPTTTTTATTAVSTTMPVMATTKATATKTKTTKTAAASTTATIGCDMSNSKPRVAAIAEATQWLATPNGSGNINSAELTSFRNGNSCAAGVKSEETPRSSRPSRCVIATAAPTSATSSASINLHSNSSSNNSMCNATAVSNGTSCGSGSSKPRNDCDDPQDSNMQCSRANCAPPHKCVFFIDEDELLPVDEADGEAYCDEDDNTSDAANSTGDSITNTSGFCAGANMSHREKQLMKYRKRMLKRDKKHHHHHQRKPLSNSVDATCEQEATHEVQRAQVEEHDEANCCQPMEEGDEDDAAVHCSNTMTTLLSRTSTRIEMISTGTQTPLSCCRQCGCEKTLVCMRCNSGSMREEPAINEPTEPDVDDMDDSTASSLSSSEIIHTPRNKAELLLQAIQRTPKVAAAKHKKEQPRKLCGGKLQNNNHLSGVSTTHVNVGAKSSGSSLHENPLAGCQVCKRQKTQHNFGTSNGEEATASTNEHLADEAENADIGDDTDDDGGKQLEDIKFVAESAEDIQLPVTPLTALPTHTQIMEEESFLSSTKLTPQIDRCTLSSATNAARYPPLTRGDHACGDQNVECSDRSENRTPPAITNIMDDERFDESQFKTPTTTATCGANSPQLQTQQRQQGTHKAFQHKQTPKPNLLQLHCNYHSNVNASSNQAVGAAGDGFAVVRANNNDVVTANKPHKQPQPHNALLLRKGLPKVNLTPIFCNPMPSPTGASLTSSHSSPIPIHGATNDITFCFEPTMLHRSGNQLQLHHQLMHSSSGNVSASPLTTEVNNIPVQKSYSAPTLPNSPSLSPRFAKQAAIYKRRSRHLSDRSDRSSLGSDEQFSDEDLESAGMYSPATSPLKQSARVAAAFGRQPLLGNLEESLLQKRLMPKVEVMGFTVLLGASGGFCPTQLTIPAASYFYELRGESLSTPYVCEIRLPRKGYSVPRAGNVQATLLNPMGTVVRMFVIPYDMRDMPPLHQTFIRQRILAEASTHEATTQNVQSSSTSTKMEQQPYTNGYGGGSGRGAGGDDNLNINNNNSECYQNNNRNNNGNNNNNAKNKYRLSPSGGLHGESNLGHFISAENMKRLRYSIHLRFQTSRSGRLSLHTDIRLLISRRTDCDTAAAHAKGVLEAPNDLVTDTVMPTNPKYSARQDQSSSTSNSNGNGSGSGSSNLNVIATTVGATNSTTVTTNNHNGSGSNKI